MMQDKESPHIKLSQGNSVSRSNPDLVAPPQVHALLEKKVAAIQSFGAVAADLSGDKVFLPRRLKNPLHIYDVILGLSNRFSNSELEYLLLSAVFEHI
jgi:hypothetical protein